jgi:hypothetical protein
LSSVYHFWPGVLMYECNELEERRKKSLGKHSRNDIDDDEADDDGEYYFIERANDECLLYNIYLSNFFLYSFDSSIKNFSSINKLYFHIK